MSKEDWGNDIRPYNEFEDVRPEHRSSDEWDEPENVHRYTRRDANLSVDIEQIYSLNGL